MMLFIRILAAVLAWLAAFIPYRGGEKTLEYDHFTLEAYMTPIWRGHTVYNETLMFVCDENGAVEPAPLLYEPIKILSVRSFDLQTEYTPGVDYTVAGGRIALTENSRIPRWQYADYYPPQAIPGGSFERTGGGYLSFGEGDTYFKTQVAVTYEHNGVWKGPVPSYRGDKLKKTVAKLKNGEELRIVFYGDSITTGANSSNTQAPYAPIWTTLVTRSLAAAYDNPNIVEINTAVGGTTSSWGVENARELAAAHDPDLVVLAFGMNDAGKSAAEYGWNISRIICRVRQSNKDAEFILVSPMLPNREAKGFFGNQGSFENALEQLDCLWEGVAVAPVWSMHEYMLKTKRYYDMTGNNVNHPNDYLARVYAQTTAALLTEPERSIWNESE